MRPGGGGGGAAISGKDDLKKISSDGKKNDARVPSVEVVIAGRGVDETAVDSSSPSLFFVVNANVSSGLTSD